MSDRCPACGSTALHQQLDRIHFSCAQCGYLAKLQQRIEIVKDEWE